MKGSIMRRIVLAVSTCLMFVPPALAQQSCPLSLEGRWIDDPSSNIKGKTNQITGFFLRRQGEGYYVTAIYDYGAKAVPRGAFKGSAGELTVNRVLGFDDLSTMFAGTVVGPLAVNALANQRISIKRTYKLLPDGSTIQVSGDTVSASVQPNGMLDNWQKQHIEYKSLRAAYPRPCERDEREAGWNDFKTRANAFRDAKNKPALSDEVRQHGMLGLDAVNGKNFDQALDEFEAGLRIDPLWPTGQYNAAMAYAQMMDYADAAFHMKAYLELTPSDDKEFQANKDRLLLWQGKLGQQMAEHPQAVPDDD